MVMFLGLGLFGLVLVESVLADAYRFSGRPLPSRGLVLGRGRASFRVVKLGGHKVRKARGYAVDAHDAADVFLYRDSSIAPLLDMRRRLKAVMDLVTSIMVFAAFIVVSVILFMLLLFIDWMSLLGVGEIGFGRIHLFTRISGLGLIWFPLPLFFSVNRILLLVVLGYFLILPGLTRNSERPGFPIFVALGKGRPALRNSMRKSWGGLLLLPEVALP